MIAYVVMCGMRVKAGAGAGRWIVYSCVGSYVYSYVIHISTGSYRKLLKISDCIAVADIYNGDCMNNARRSLARK
jgi:hypothetical protein